MQQLVLGTDDTTTFVEPFKTQLLKWIGNKQRFAHEIASYFPIEYGGYHEPFLGSGAVLGTVAPDRGFGSDAFGPLIDIWKTLRTDPDLVKHWYRERWLEMARGNKVGVYERIKASYNECPNPADFLFLTRSCYGGVVRFRQADGYMSTPCGSHSPVAPSSFDRRVDSWFIRTKGTTFSHCDFEEAMAQAVPGDVVYCDPPYSDTQAILYGAQRFRLERLVDAIASCKNKGVFVLLSIDGTKKSGGRTVKFDFPVGLFEREVFVNCGVSQLRRFQSCGETLNGESVSDRLMLTY